MKNLVDMLLEQKYLINANTNNAVLDKKRLSKISDTLFDSGEHSGFRKGTTTELLKTKDLKARLNKYYGSDTEYIDKKLYNIVKDNASDEILVILGTGYDGTWSFVVFFNTKPYKFVICHDGDISELCQLNTSNEVEDKIIDFC